MWALLAGFSFALFTAGLYWCNRSFGDESPISAKIWLMGRVFLYSYAIIVSVSYVIGIHIDFAYDIVGLVIALNGVRLALVYLLYNEAMRRIPPLAVSVLVSMEIVFTVALERWFLAEPMSSAFVIGTILIVAATWSLIVDNAQRVKRLLSKPEAG
jgi:drug/metabolite transporter (DMT)-like permease